MDEHKRLIQEYVNKVACSKNSKVLSKDKYDKIVNHLIESANGDPKFRWWVEKKRGYKLMNFAELGLNDVLCVPAKNQNDNNTTILSQWRIQTHSENIAEILQRLHWTEQNHVGYKKMLSQVQSRYEGIPRCVVQDACRTCPVCQMCVKQTNNAELKPIISSGFLTRAQIDLIDMRHKPDREYNYIAHYMDHWSKYHVIWPLKRKTADEVACGLNERVFPYLGLPRIIHSDNGREFVNRVIREVVNDWGGEDVLFVNGRPRHSQSQGLVEQGNATIERHIANKRATLELANDYPWASWLPKIQYNMNTEVAGGTKKNPYEVVFGQPPRTNIIPGAQGNDGVVNEEDLPFELNPDSASNNHDDITAQDEGTHTQSANDPLLRQIQDDTTIRDEREIPPTEEHPATDEPRPEDTDNDTAARGEEDVLPYIERPKPTPKPRKRRLESPAMTDPAIVTSTKQQDEEEQLPQDAADQRLPSQTCVPLEGCQDSTEHAQSLAADQRLPSETCVPLEGCQESTEQSANVCSTSTSNNPTAKHFKVRQEADANYRANAEKMKLKYSKRKRVINETFTEGDLVTVRVPKIDRSSTDQPRLVAKVVKTRGTVDKWYQLQCKFGILDGWYRTGELMPYGGICSISFDNDTKVTLREAARKENPNMIQRKKCMCQGPCSKNCYCVKNSMMCTSHCHPSKTCRSVEKAQFPEISLLDRKMVNDGQELSDKHILAAQQLLKKQFPSNNGLNDTVTLASRSTPEPTPYVQIMHVNGNHWLTIAASNQKGPVEVFDSLKPAKLTASTLQSIKKYTPVYIYIAVRFEFEFNGPVNSPTEPPRRARVIR